MEDFIIDDRFFAPGGELEKIKNMTDAELDKLISELEAQINNNDVAWGIEMNQLIDKLNNVPDAYFEFIDSVIRYVKKKTSRFDVVMNYLNSSNDLLSSDILLFIAKQPDFFEDNVGTQPGIGWN